MRFHFIHSFTCTIKSSSPRDFLHRTFFRISKNNLQTIILARPMAWNLSLCFIRQTQQQSIHERLNRQGDIKMCRILTVVFNHSIFFRGKVFAPILTPRFPANSSVDYFKITKIILNMFELHSLTLKKLDFSASNKELLRLFYLFNKLFCTWLFLFSQIN